METLLPLALIVLAFWLLVIRPSRKRQQEMTRIQNSVAPGVEVMLASGIYGRVTTVGDETLDLEVAPGTQVKVARQAVVKVVDPLEDQGPVPGVEGTGDPTDRNQP